MLSAAFPWKPPQNIIAMVMSVCISTSQPVHCGWGLLQAASQQPFTLINIVYVSSYNKLIFQFLLAFHSLESLHGFFTSGTILETKLKLFFVINYDFVISSGNFVCRMRNLRVLVLCLARHQQSIKFLWLFYKPLSHFLKLHC